MYSLLGKLKVTSQLYVVRRHSIAWQILWIVHLQVSLALGRKSHSITWLRHIFEDPALSPITEQSWNDGPRAPLSVCHPCPPLGHQLPWKALHEGARFCWKTQAHVSNNLPSVSLSAVTLSSPCGLFWSSDCTARSCEPTSSEPYTAQQLTWENACWEATTAHKSPHQGCRCREWEVRGMKETQWVFDHLLFCR